MEKEPDSRQKQKKKQLNDYAKYSGMAAQMIATILLGVYGGVKLDAYFHLKYPVFTLILTLISVFLAIYLAIKDFIKK